MPDREGATGVRGLFITGVGTGVGKTLVTTILCRQLIAEGRSVAALKPVVSGYSEHDADSDPALILRSLGRTATPDAVAAVAPWRLSAPVSPHLAARREGRSIDLEDLVAFCRRPEHADADVRIVEGAGGVMSPIGPGTTCLDWIASLGDPVVLVTGSYLGAISHTLTALGCLTGRGADVRGVVVSESTESAGLTDTLDSLREYAGDVPLHVVPRLAGDLDARWTHRALLDRTLPRPLGQRRCLNAARNDPNPRRRAALPGTNRESPTSGFPIARCSLPPPPLPVVRTEGCRIILADGRELVDGIASWWSACHGYNHPHIRQAVERQLLAMPHVMFGGLAHEPAFVLAERLTAMAPSGLNRVFFTDSGSIAVEVALEDRPAILAQRRTAREAPLRLLRRRLPWRHLRSDVGVGPRAVDAQGVPPRPGSTPRR